MIVEYVRYRLQPGRSEAFLDAYTQAAASLDASEFCTGYEMSRCVEEPDVFVLRILWTSAEDHKQGFRGSAEFRAFLPHIRPYINEIEEMRHYERTAIASS